MREVKKLGAIVVAIGYADAKSTRKRLDDEYAEYKVILTELGVAK